MSGLPVVVVMFAGKAACRVGGIVVLQKGGEIIDLESLDVDCWH
jgi:hypothetical protein